MVSPYTRRAALDRTLYTTSAMLRTMEIILGLPPMSQLDAAATPMYAAFQAEPALAPYGHRPARVSLDDRKEPGARGAAASEAMDLEEADPAPELALNEILWKPGRTLHARRPGRPG